jgi:hypothetical protein
MAEIDKDENFFETKVREHYQQPKTGARQNACGFFANAGITLTMSKTHHDSTNKVKVPTAEKRIPGV